MLPPGFRVFLKVRDTSDYFPRLPHNHPSISQFYMQSKLGGAGRVWVCVEQSYRTPHMLNILIKHVVKASPLNRVILSLTLSLASFLPLQSAQVYLASPSSTLLRAWTADWRAHLRTRCGELSRDALLCLVRPECKLPYVPESTFCSTSECLSLEMKVLIPEQGAVSWCALTSRTTEAGGGTYSLRV